MTWKTKIRYEGDCWMWMAATTKDGYGGYQGRLAHRVVFTELRGKSPGRLINTCGNAGCVNPNHWSERSEEERFWAKVTKTRKCWVWIGGVDGKGYGAFRDRQGVQQIAHRMAWKFLYGNFPDGKLLHKCDTPKCIRPDHMFVGTQADNVADAVQKGRHPKNERHGAAKLTWDDVHEIRFRYATGDSQTKIAEDFVVSQKSISNIVRRKTWRETKI